MEVQNLDDGIDSSFFFKVRNFGWLHLTRLIEVWPSGWKGLMDYSLKSAVTGLKQSFVLKG